ncbi:hypothetical protein NPA31_005235 [Aurantimonas sp. MSK8Z-1]|uniref:hypothetical protein n=1 Tax=Mangrovibrevibacter kandeliae TaxID=2968473 RepID=UPI00211740B5|nr:hypothetical protein [Aurantimonas sp. MSK8Z-1]MCW4114365.1 hypothetical protein [Aurantimonas sp. MSK8Z-1]
MSKWWINGMPFTCENSRFKTDITKGKPHGQAAALGSVLDQPLVSHGYTLWLKHVIDKNGGPDQFWLIWYDPKGAPTIPASGVLGPDEIREITRQLSAFIKI